MLSRFLIALAALGCSSALAQEGFFSNGRPVQEFTPIERSTIVSPKQFPGCQFALTDETLPNGHRKHLGFNGHEIIFDYRSDGRLASVDSGSGPWTIVYGDGAPVGITNAKGEAFTYPPADPNLIARLRAESKLPDPNKVMESICGAIHRKSDPSSLSGDNMTYTVYLNPGYWTDYFDGEFASEMTDFLASYQPPAPVPQCSQALTDCFNACDRRAGWSMAALIGVTGLLIEAPPISIAVLALGTGLLAEATIACKDACPSRLPACW